MIPDVDANVRILSGGRRLEIVSATTRDTADYRCVASNPAGTVSRDFSLFVFGELTFMCYSLSFRYWFDHTFCFSMRVQDRLYIEVSQRLEYF